MSTHERPFAIDVAQMTSFRSSLVRAAGVTPSLNLFGAHSGDSGEWARLTNQGNQRDFESWLAESDWREVCGWPQELSLEQFAVHRRWFLAWPNLHLPCLWESAFHLADGTIGSQLDSRVAEFDEVAKRGVALFDDLVTESAVQEPRPPLAAHPSERWLQIVTRASPVEACFFGGKVSRLWMSIEPVALSAAALPRLGEHLIYARFLRRVRTIFEFGEHVPFEPGSRRLWEHYIFAMHRTHLKRPQVDRCLAEYDAALSAWRATCEPPAEQQQTLSKPSGSLDTKESVAEDPWSYCQILWMGIVG